MRILKRWFISFQLYAIDIYIHDLSVALEGLTDPILSDAAQENLEWAKKERTRMRAEYNATLPIGCRRIWADA